MRIERLLLVLALTSGTLAGPFRSKPLSTYLKLGGRLMSVPHAWGSSGSKMSFSERSVGLGLYGEHAFTARFGTIVSGSMLSYATAEFFDGVPQERITKTAFAGPWSVRATAHIVEWGESGLGAEAGISWVFNTMPGGLGPQGVVQLDLGRKLQAIRSELWADLGVRLSIKNQTRPRGKLQLGIKHHDRKWRWEIKGLVEATASLDRSGLRNDRIVLVEEQRVSMDSSLVTVTSEAGRYLSDSFTGAVAGTWYLAKGVGVDVSYRQTFWGRGVSAARTIGVGVSYAWTLKNAKSN